jgi:hypothetical protein
VRAEHPTRSFVAPAQLTPRVGHANLFEQRRAHEAVRPLHTFGGTTPREWAAMPMGQPPLAAPRDERPAPPAIHTQAYASQIRGNTARAPVDYSRAAPRAPDSPRSAPSPRAAAVQPYAPADPPAAPASSRRDLGDWMPTKAQLRAEAAASAETQALAGEAIARIGDIAYARGSAFTGALFRHFGELADDHARAEAANAARDSAMLAHQSAARDVRGGRSPRAEPAVIALASRDRQAASALRVVDFPRLLDRLGLGVHRDAALALASVLDTDCDGVVKAAELAAMLRLEPAGLGRQRGAQGLSPRHEPPEPATARGGEATDRRHLDWSWSRAPPPVQAAMAPPSPRAGLEPPASQPPAGQPPAALCVLVDAPAHGDGRQAMAPPPLPPGYASHTERHANDAEVAATVDRPQRVAPQPPPQPAFGWAPLDDNGRAHMYLADHPLGKPSPRQQHQQPYHTLALTRDGVAARDGVAHNGVTAPASPRDDRSYHPGGHQMPPSRLGHVAPASPRAPSSPRESLARHYEPPPPHGGRGASSRASPRGPAAESAAAAWLWQHAEPSALSVELQQLVDRPYMLGAHRHTGRVCARASRTLRATDGRARHGRRARMTPSHDTCPSRPFLCLPLALASLRIT